MPTSALCRMFRPSAKAAIIPYSMPLWTILTKCPAPDGAAVQVALLLRRQLAVAARRPLDLPDPRGDGLQDRLDGLDRDLVAADHQAVAALQAEDAAAGADVDVVDALLPQLLGPADVVAVVGVAAVDDDVALVEERGDLVDDLPGDAGRDHHPDGPRLLELADELLQRRAAGRALILELLDRLGVDVEDHALVSVAHQPPHDVGAHPTQPDHSQLHDKLLIFDDSRRLSST